jgi:hypothetical protein
MAIASAERRIHEDRPAPRLHQAVVLLRVSYALAPNEQGRASTDLDQDQSERVERASQKKWIFFSPPPLAVLRLKFPTLV